VQKETKGYAVFCNGKIFIDVWNSFGIYSELQRTKNRAQFFPIHYKIVPVIITIDELQEVEDALDRKE
jgi:hypothetical protein